MRQLDQKFVDDVLDTFRRLKDSTPYNVTVSDVWKEVQKAHPEETFDDLKEAVAGHIAWGNMDAEEGEMVTETRLFYPGKRY